MVRLASTPAASKAEHERARAQRTRAWYLVCVRQLAFQHPRSADSRCTERDHSRANAAGVACPPRRQPLCPTLDVPLLVDPAWYAAKDLDLYPSCRWRRLNRFTLNQLADISGECTLLLQIDEFGSGAGRDSGQRPSRPATSRRRRCRPSRLAHFTPAQRDGHPVRSRIVVKVRLAPQARRQQAQGFETPARGKPFGSSTHILPGLAHAARLRCRLVAAAPVEIGAHRALDRAARVLRHHQSVERQTSSWARWCSRNTGAPSGTARGSTATLRPGVSGTPSAPEGPLPHRLAARGRRRSWHCC